MDIRSATRAALGMIGTTLSFVATAGAQDRPYLSDLPKLYPAAYTLWTQSLPYALGPLPDWLAGLKGVVTPIRDVSVGGVPMKFGTTCMPHDCGGNISGVLFSPQGNRIVALVRLGSKGTASNVMIVGSMTSAEISCVQRLIGNDQAASC